MIFEGEKWNNFEISLEALNIKLLLISDLKFWGLFDSSALQEITGLQTAGPSWSWDTSIVWRDLRFFSGSFQSPRASSAHTVKTFLSILVCLLFYLLCLQLKLLFWSGFSQRFPPLAPPAALCVHSTGWLLLWLLIRVFFRPEGLQEGRWDVHSCGRVLRYTGPAQV